MIKETHSSHFMSYTILINNQESFIRRNLCYTCCGAMAGIRNNSSSTWESIWWPIAPWANALSLSYISFPRPILNASTICKMFFASFTKLWYLINANLLNGVGFYYVNQFYIFNSSLSILSTIPRKGRKCFLFIDALNTFYLRLYGVRHMVKVNSDNERWNLLSHGLLFHFSSKGYFICTIPQTG